MPTDPLLERAALQLKKRAQTEGIDPSPTAALLKGGRYADALKEARRGCEASGASPAYARWIGLSAAFASQPAEAEPWLLLATQFDPRDAQAHAVLGAVGGVLGRVDRVRHHRQAVELEPRNAQFRASCADALLEAGELDEAEQAARAALALSADYGPALSVFGRVLYAQGKPANAFALLEAALPAAKDHHAERALAFLYLRAGRYQEGFRHYESCRRSINFGMSELRSGPPEWLGEPIPGQRLLIRHEQGMGDTLMAMRYAAILAERGVQVSATVNRPLERLLAAQPYLKRVYGPGARISITQYDRWCYAMSLPGRVGEDGSSGRRVPYIAAPAGEIDFGSDSRGLKVGISWQGNRANPHDALRSIEPGRFAALASVPGVCLISCQHGVDSAALPAFVRPPPVTINDLADAAMLLKHLDLLITVDSAPAHLAGAMGLEVWLLARWFGDWRWADTGSATHWYPTMRVLRQPAAGDWRTPLAEVASSLKKRRPG